MLLNTIDTSSMHSISSLLDTITHLTPGAQPGETTRQRNADNGSLERERDRERQRERECVCVDTVWGATLVIQLREREREREGPPTTVRRRRS